MGWWLRDGHPLCSRALPPQVDNAYDVLLMQSLTKRRSGVVTDSRVKYADVPRPVKVLRRFCRQPRSLSALMHVSSDLSPRRRPAFWCLGLARAATPLALLAASRRLNLSPLCSTSLRSKLPRRPSRRSSRGRRFR